MAQMTANGTPVLKATITENEKGTWLARIEVDDDENALAGKVTLTTGTYSWIGTVMPSTSRVEAGRSICDVIGGANGLTMVLTPKYYVGANLGTILTDIARECGETLDLASSAPGISDYQVPCWMRAQGEARVALDAVATELGGAYWRITRAGTLVMLLDDTWEEADDAYTEIGRDPSRSLVRIAPDEEPFARPGISVGGDRIVTARTELDSKRMRQNLQVHDDTDRGQDITAVMLDLAQRANALSNVYGRLYPAKVLAQDEDGTLQLQPDSALMRIGLTRVPMRHGIPGLTVKVVPGQYVNLYFENSDPKRPAAALWPDGSSVLSVELDAQEKVAISAPQIALGAEATQSNLCGENMHTYLDLVFSAVQSGFSAVPGSGSTIASTFKTALEALAANKQATLSTTIKVQ